MPSSEQGEELYEQHCAACHGTYGSGRGFAAIALQVRPRDLRAEPFRYVSSLDGRATTEDLEQTIRRGRLEGEMPAHPDFTDAEVRLLVDYVRQLNRFGVIGRLEEEFSGDGTTTRDEIEEIADEMVASGEAIEIGPPPFNYRFDPDTGRRLYMEACASCHGPSGRGDGLEMPQDASGRPIAVRDLTGGEFRGGGDPVELYKRIRCGIPGTPMPAQLAMSDEQVWQLADYVRLLANRK